jgi:hypothetical protein
MACDTLIFIMIDFFFPLKMIDFFSTEKNSSFNSRPKMHRFGLCSQHFVKILFFWCTGAKAGSYCECADHPDDSGPPLLPRAASCSFATEWYVQAHTDNIDRSNFFDHSNLTIQI